MFVSTQYISMISMIAVLSGEAYFIVQQQRAKTIDLRGQHRADYKKIVMVRAMYVIKQVFNKLFAISIDRARKEMYKKVIDFVPSISVHI